MHRVDLVATAAREFVRLNGLRELKAASRKVDFDDICRLCIAVGAGIRSTCIAFQMTEAKP